MSTTEYATDEDRRDDALCREVGATLFFPESEDDSGELAKRVCAVCPVTEACLWYALAHPELEGVWGGASERQRVLMRSGHLPAVPPALPSGGHPYTGRLYACDCGLEGCTGLVSDAARRRHRNRVQVRRERRAVAA